MSDKQMWRGLWAALIVWFVGCLALWAGTINLQWDAVDPPPAKYRVYSGPSSGQYDTQKDVPGSVVATTVPVLDCSVAYAVVKAVNTQGEESAEFSNEVYGWGRPIVVSGHPQAVKVPQGNQTVDYPIVIEGVNFQAGATVNISDASAQVVSVAVTSCRKITAVLRVDNTVALGQADVEVINPDQVYGTGSSLVTFYHGPAPVGGLRKAQ